MESRFVCFQFCSVVTVYVAPLRQRKGKGSRKETLNENNQDILKLGLTFYSSNTPKPMTLLLWEGEASVLWRPKGLLP